MADRDHGPMPGARHQTRPFLFADLRGYSAYTDRYGDRAAEDLIGRYRRLVRTHISAFQGAEIRTEGDSFLRYAYTVIRTALGQAVRQGKVIRNVATLTDPPRRNGREMHPLTRDEARARNRLAQPMEAVLG